MQGNGFAQQALGFLYQEGHGVPIDYELAYFWDSLAASRLSGPAMLAVAKRRDDMAALLSSDVLTVLQTAATQWKPGTEPPAGRPVRPASAMAHSL
jgi:TPR repeat protein